jgi:uncharacterized RDD family membrane protein YckC
MEKASLLLRLVALIIDNIILSIVGAIIGAVLGDQSLGFLISFVIGLVYQVGMLTANNGQTIGKMLLGLRVVQTDGGSVNAMNAGLRYIGYYLNTILIFLGWLLAIVDSRGQGLHDKIAGTMVVKA